MAGVLVLTVVTLSVYFYFYLYGWLHRLAERTEAPPARAAVLRARTWITVGLGLQFVAFLIPLLALFPVLSNPDDVDALVRGLSDAQLALPAGPAAAMSAATLGNWAGWIVFWVSLLWFLVGRLADAGLPAGAAGFARVLVGFRVLAGLAGLLGAGAVAGAVESLDVVLFLVLVGCAASAVETLDGASFEDPVPARTD